MTESLRDPRAGSTVERAYQLAASGECLTLREIRARLSAEAYPAVAQHLHGQAITVALKRLCRLASGAPPRQPPVRAPAGTTAS